MSRLLVSTHRNAASLWTIPGISQLPPAKATRELAVLEPSTAAGISTCLATSITSGLRSFAI